MSNAAYAMKQINFHEKAGELYRRVGFFVATAIVLSGVIIIYFNQTILGNERVLEMYNSLELAAMSLVPYMISAVIAAITAIFIINYIPMLKSRPSAMQIALRLRAMGEGDLSAKMRVDCSNEYLKEIAQELNYSVSAISNLVAQSKIINRQQWDLLQGIRQATAQSDAKSVYLFIDKMTYNWKRIAEIEEKLRT